MTKFNDNQHLEYPPFPPFHPGLIDSYKTVVLSSVGRGLPGPQGPAMDFDSLTKEQKNELVKGTSSWANKCVEATFVTSASVTTKIPVPISDYSNYDMLFVDINGLDLVRDVDYTLSNGVVTLTTPLTGVGNEVHFKALSYESTDGAKYLVVAPTIANPVEWDGSRVYDPYVVVKHGEKSYISLKQVPSGTLINNTEYWMLWSDADPRIIAVENNVNDIAGNDFEIIIHETEGYDDSSWFLMKMPRSKVAYDVTNCSGNSADAKARISNPRDFLKSHGEYFMATNCNYGGNDYPMRVGGINYSGTNGTRPYLGHKENGDVAFFPVGTNLEDIDGNYTSMYAVDALLISNGIVQPGLGDTKVEPRAAFGWDDDNYWYFFCEGRGPYQRGMTIQEVASIGHKYGIQNFVNQDGGGSICAAANVNGVYKFNKYRDQQYAFNELRPVSLCQCFKMKDGSDVPIVVKDSISKYMATNTGYSAPFLYITHTENWDAESIDTDDAFVPSGDATKMNTLQWNNIRLKDGYTPTPILQIPFPYMHYLNQPVKASGYIEVFTPEGLNTASPPGHNEYVSVQLKIGYLDSDGNITGSGLKVSRTFRITVPASNQAKRTHVPFEVIYAVNTGDDWTDQQYVASLEVANAEGCKIHLAYLEAGVLPTVTS